MRVGFLALVLIAAPLVKACTCDYSVVPRCQQLRSFRGTALFVGTVKSIRYRDVNLSGALVKEQLVTLKVEDAFQGIQGKKVEVRSFASPSMCGYAFRKGSRYLVDAWGPRESLNVTSCGMTTGAAEAADLIRFLRTLRQHPSGGIVFGTVKKYVTGSTFVSLDNKAVSGTTVALDSQLDGMLRSERKLTSVDSSGWYEFIGLPTGVYTVTAQMPSGFEGVLQHTVDVDWNRCAQIDIRVRANAE